jgi:subtilisin family serine protease
MGVQPRILRSVCPWLVVGLLLFGVTATVEAVQIDPELKALLDQKTSDEIINVLMLFPDEPDLDDLEVLLEDATPSKRRRAAVAALKRQARKAQAEAWEFFEGADLPGRLDYAEMLYFSNAIAFGSDREVILALAGSKNLDAAILFHDKPYVLIEGLPGPSDGLKAAASDTTWNVRYIGADRVWRELGLTGEGILIGHIDTGVDLLHPDLKQRLWRNPGEVAGSGADDDGNGFVDDVFGWDFGDNNPDPSDNSSIAGHGTHTAGILVGDGTAGLQTGVAPGARLLPVKIFTAAGTSSLGRIWAAQQYCVENGARIISMSLGIKGAVSPLYMRNDRYNAAAIRTAGVTLFNSAGNYHGEFPPPLELGMTARIPAPWSGVPVPHSSTGGVVTVGGTAYQSDAPFAISSQGPTTWELVSPWFDWPYVPGPGLIKPDLVAPAQGIGSTLPGGLYSGETWSGTSMAAPHAAGVAALMLQKNPTLSPAGIDSLLELTARDLGTPGKDNIHGAGVLDAFAAVMAVPTDQHPDLQVTGFQLDADGDSVMDPGEIPAVVFTVANVGQVPATGVVGRLVISQNNNVFVDVSEAFFPEIAPGASVDNAGSPFRLAVSPLALQGHTFMMHLTLATAAGFERSFDLEGHIGLPEHRTHDRGQIYLTVTSRGSLGYVDDQRLQGQGLGPLGGSSQLFISSLWGGTDLGYLCNNDLTANGQDPAEWLPRHAPAGNVRVLQDDADAQLFAMAFTDSGHAQPRGVEVSLVSRAFADPALADVVVLDYTISNTSSQPLAGYHAGLFMDWDVYDAFANVGGVDAQRRAVWVGLPDGAVGGVALLGEAPVSNLTLIDNTTYIFPRDHVTDAHKLQFLRGNIVQTAATTPTDLSALVAAGPFQLAPGQVVNVSFAVAFAADLDALLASVATAGGDSGPVTAVAPEVPTARLVLGQNQPNPFNPVTEIHFTLAAAGRAELAIYSPSGQRVRTLLSESLPAGPHAVRWDGLNDAGRPQASGLYLYRLEAEGRTLTRKMLLVR